MAKFHGRVSKFLLDDTSGTQHDLSTYLNDMSGLPGGRELLQQTGVGASGRERDAGLKNGMFRIAGFYDDTATSGPDAVLGPLVDHTAAVDFEYGPKGSTGGYVKYYGTCWCRRYSLGSSIAGMVTFTAEFEVQGQVNRGTF